MSGYVVTLRDPSLLGGNPITTDHATKEIAAHEYRELLATMWRRPGGSLELAVNGVIVASFPPKEEA